MKVLLTFLPFLAVSLSGCFDYSSYIYYDGQRYPDINTYKELKYAPLLISTSLRKRPNVHLYPLLVVSVDSKDSLYELHLTLTHKIDSLVAIKKVTAEIKDTLGNIWKNIVLDSIPDFRSDSLDVRPFYIATDFGIRHQLTQLNKQPQTFLVSYRFLFKYSSGRETDFELLNVPHKFTKRQTFGLFSF